jgi:hypothetical protein
MSCGAALQARVYFENRKRITSAHRAGKFAPRKSAGKMRVKLRGGKLRIVPGRPACLLIRETLIVWATAIFFN